MSDDAVRWVLIDNCGGVASLVLLRGADVVGSETVEGRGFSATWPARLRGLLAAVTWDVRSLEMVAVVNGPGSFTGLRVGLAAAKGLCEAVGARLIALSKLEMMSAAGGEGAVAVLDAGRGEFYVRDAGRESLMSTAELVAAVEGREVVAVEAKVAELLGVALTTVEAFAAVPLALGRWQLGQFDDVAAVDANYVRGERDIYAKKAVA